MSFWTNSAYRFEQLTEIKEDELLNVVNSMERLDFVKWLTWNDPNGIYGDELSLAEFNNIMSREEGVEILLRQVRENRVTT